MQIRPRNPPSTPRKTARDIGRGRRENIITGPAPKAPTQATQAQATPPQINITNIRIKPGNTTVYLFPERKPFVNRRFTPYEREQEKIDALFLKRPQREFFYDPPTYPYCVPEPKVNFDLGWR